MSLPVGLAETIADGIAPALSRWSHSREKQILTAGEQLDPESLAFASKIGIAAPETVRVVLAEDIPLPLHRTLIRLAQGLGFAVFHPSGMALGNGIILTQHHPAVMRHELVHVKQYQNLGGHLPFMQHYVRQCLSVGYFDAPLEVEARALSKNH